ncbi:glycine-rich RNA-binding protein 4, mitochondrial [Tanacetum coccineum]|uniref:Glycine-rich RNA-binding protein 4, mitochondrial n=1 Tax=Tanacetum coccineum TaxID=301880 RepID=A0ABQ5DLF4_9ASTR
MSEKGCSIVNASVLVGFLGAYNLRVATPRAVVHADDKTSRDDRSWYMISGDAKSWVVIVCIYSLSYSTFVQLFETLAQQLGLLLNCELTNIILDVFEYHFHEKEKVLLSIPGENNGLRSVIMAFYNKIGSLMRQNVSQTVMSNGQPSMLNAIRCMSSKLFVGGLSYQTDDHSLKEAFSSFGEVTEGENIIHILPFLDMLDFCLFFYDSARVITDRESGRSRGFGFVNYDADESANAAMKAMDGQELNGRSIRVSLATERPPRQGGFGGGGGGYNRNFNDAGNDRSIMNSLVRHVFVLALPVSLRFLVFSLYTFWDVVMSSISLAIAHEAFTIGGFARAHLNDS